MPELEAPLDVLGPWSLATCLRFWAGFTPSALAHDPAADGDSPVLRTAFRQDAGWDRVEAEVRQEVGVAHVRVRGDGDLEAATAQVARFLSLDVDARAWTDVARRDPVVADAQRRLPGLRPCGFHSPYEAACWAVLSQRVRAVQAATLRRGIVADHGGVLPSPGVLRGLDLDLPGRKTEYLRAVADAALDEHLDGARLRALDPDDALRSVQEVRGLGPFAAELVVIRGAAAPDVLPRHERRFTAEVAERYGKDADLATVAESWRPLRSWAVLHLRALREERTGEIGGGRAA